MDIVTSKRAVMYSITALMLFFLVMHMASTSYFFFVADDDLVSRNMLSDQLYRFTYNIDSDLEKAIDVSARRALVTAINYILEQGEPLDTTVTRISELMRYGTLYGEDQELMEENTLTYWTSRMEEQGKDAGFDVELNYSDFSIQMVDPFTILFNITVEINTSDVFLTINLTRSTEKNVLVPIDGFEDPTFPLNTFGRIKRVIRQTPYSSYVVSLANGTSALGTTYNTTILANSSDSVYIAGIPNKDTKVLVTDNATNIPPATLSQFAGVISETQDVPSISVYLVGTQDCMDTVPNNTLVYIDETTIKVWYMDPLVQAINRTYYIQSGNGPSFFDRLEGRLTNSYGYGIESFVDFDELGDYDLDVYAGKTCVDYYYFDSQSHPGFTVRGLYYTWFRIDNETSDGLLHPNKYGVEELI